MMIVKHGMTPFQLACDTSVHQAPSPGSPIQGKRPRSRSVRAAFLALAMAGALAPLSLAAPASAGEGGEKTFTTPGEHTFTVPGGVTKITVKAWGAGGGGGGAGGSGGGGGGGGGGYVECELTVEPGEEVPVVVGGGGGGGAGFQDGTNGRAGHGPHGGAGGTPGNGKPFGDPGASDAWVRDGVSVRERTDGSGGGGGGLRLRDNGVQPTSNHGGGGAGGGGGSSVGEGTDDDENEGVAVAFGGHGGNAGRGDGAYPSGNGGHGDVHGGSGGFGLIMYSDTSQPGGEGLGGASGTCEGAQAGDGPGAFDGAPGGKGQLPPDAPGDFVVQGGAGGTTKGAATAGAGGEGGSSEVHMKAGVGYTTQGKGGHAGTDGADGRVEITW